MVIVAGITRSGLTAMMQMLYSGGYPCLGEYPAFEKYQIGCIQWEDCHDKAVKLVDAHLQLPPEGNYRIIRLVRDMNEQAKSINKIFLAMGLKSAKKKLLISSLKKDYAIIDNWSAKHDTLRVTFENIITNPSKTAEGISGWIGKSLDIAEMAASIIKRKTNCYHGILEFEMINK